MKNIKLFAILSAMILGVFSCQNFEEELTTIEPEQILTVNALGKKDTIGEQANTKVSAELDLSVAGKIKLAWEPEDKITIYTEDGEKCGNWKVMSIDENGDAKFIKVDGEKLVDDVSYSAVYPASDSLTLDARNKVKIGELTQKANNDILHLKNSIRMSTKNGYYSTFSLGGNIDFGHDNTYFSVRYKPEGELTPIRLQILSPEDDHEYLLTPQGECTAGEAYTAYFVIDIKYGMDDVKFTLYDSKNDTIATKKMDHIYFNKGSHYRWNIALPDSIPTGLEVSINHQNVDDDSLAMASLDNIYVYSLDESGKFNNYHGSFFHNDKYKFPMSVGHHHMLYLNSKIDSVRNVTIVYPDTLEDGHPIVYWQLNDIDETAGSDNPAKNSLFKDKPWYQSSAFKINAQYSSIHHSEPSVILSCSREQTVYQYPMETEFKDFIFSEYTLYSSKLTDKTNISINFLGFDDVKAAYISAAPFYGSRGINGSYENNGATQSICQETQLELKKNGDGSFVAKKVLCNFGTDNSITEGLCDSIYKNCNIYNYYASINAHLCVIVEYTNSETGDEIQYIERSYGLNSGYNNSFDIYDPSYFISELKLDRDSIELMTDGEYDLAVSIIPESAQETGVAWKSLDEYIASVDENGKVSAHIPGRARIVVSPSRYGTNPYRPNSDANKQHLMQDTCIVVVKPVPVESISLDKSSISMHRGQINKLNVSIYPEDAYNKNVTFSSSNDSIVEARWISEYNEVTDTEESYCKLVAHAAGTVTITATSEDGNKIATCEITATKRTDNNYEIGEMYYDGNDKPLGWVYEKTDKGCKIVKIVQGAAWYVSGGTCEDGDDNLVSLRFMWRPARFYANTTDKYSGMKNMQTAWKNAGTEALEPFDRHYTFYAVHKENIKLNPLFSGDTYAEGVKNVYFLPAVKEAVKILPHLYKMGFDKYQRTDCRLGMSSTKGFYDDEFENPYEATYAFWLNDSSYQYPIWCADGGDVFAAMEIEF